MKLSNKHLKSYSSKRRVKIYLADQNKHKKTSSEKKIYFPNHVQSPKSSQIAFEETCGCQIRL